MRKRSSSKVPAKGRLREMADTLWSLAVRADWNWRCAVCGEKKVEAHHLVPRQHEATRYDLKNGVALCVQHHKFNKYISPHQNAAGWIEWLESCFPERAEWLFENCRPTFRGVKTAAYYCDVIRDLRQYVEEDEFVRVVGVRFAAYLEEQS